MQQTGKQTCLVVLGKLISGFVEAMEGHLHVPVVVGLERQCVREHNAAQLVFRAESQRVGTCFPWDYLTCFLLTKEILGKHLD